MYVTQRRRESRIPCPLPYSDPTMGGVAFGTLGAAEHFRQSPRDLEKEM